MNECTPGLAMPIFQAAGLGPDQKIEPFMDRLSGTKKMCETAKHFRQSFLWESTYLCKASPKAKDFSLVPE